MASSKKTVLFVTAVNVLRFDIASDMVSAKAVVSNQRHAILQLRPFSFHSHQNVLVCLTAALAAGRRVLQVTWYAGLLRVPCPVN